MQVVCVRSCSCVANAINNITKENASANGNEKSHKLIMWKSKRKISGMFFSELPHSRKDTQNFLTVVDIESQVC